jgi:hypothetical protein
VYPVLIGGVGGIKLIGFPSLYAVEYSPVQHSAVVAL